MINRHVPKDLMAEALYGELGQAEKVSFDRHLRDCPVCASEYAALEATLRLMDKRERPDPGPAFWDGYWNRLSKRMLWESIEEGRAPSLAARLIRPFARLPRWSLQAAAATALLLLGILVGSRLIPRPEGARAVAAGPSAAASAPSPAVVEAGNFVERSKLLLLGLVNFDPATEDRYALDLDGKKAVSRTLAAEAPALRGALKEPGERRLRELVTDLEVILMQIANLEAGQDLEGVDLIKQGVDRRGIFLKIDLDRMGREARGPAAPPAEKARPKKSAA
ncbi:MAG TPA: zf-HC2 domain-containing protein [Acidobacteriota bacterium]|nr:zf-HC2 domain-containing protein [Acidobacteriota bacterium]